MKRHFFAMATFLGFLMVSFVSCAQPAKNEPWKTNQLMPPEILAATLASPSAKLPLLISIGPSGLIPGSVEVGPSGNSSNLAKLKTLLQKEDRSREIVLYCGCCPFKNCPNVRPAFELLNSMGFTRHQLLNLSTNLKVDWIDKGFPVRQ